VSAVTGRPAPTGSGLPESGSGRHVGETPAGPCADAPAYRHLLRPDGASWVETERWQRSELGGTPTPLVWGQPRPRATGSATASARRVAAREVAITRLRVRSREVRVHRLPAPGAASRSVRTTLRRQLRRGTLLELGVGDGLRRPLDHVHETAGCRPLGAPMVTTDGGLLQRVRTRDGTPAILRAGLHGDRSDPMVATEALERLAWCPAVPAPRLLGAGAVGACAWSMETVLPGRPGQRLTPLVWAAVVAAWAGLPCNGAAATATADDLQRVATWLPEHASSVEVLAARAAEVAAAVPGVLGHRDLWPGNLLVGRGELCGVIDWGSWRPDVLPGSDLLHLYAAAQRRRRREPLGTAWLRAPWREPPFRRALRTYADQLGVRLPGLDYLEVLGIAWWAAEVAGTLQRVPARRDDLAWVGANVGPVVTCFEAAGRAAGRGHLHT
jgi:hypothetical protein